MIPRFNRNVWLLVGGSMLVYLASGIFAVDFNLYVLSVGIRTDELGRILSMAPFAQILAAIPIGFFAERLGFRKAFLAIYGLAEEREPGRSSSPPPSCRGWLSPAISWCACPSWRLTPRRASSARRSSAWRPS